MLTGMADTLNSTKFRRTPGAIHTFTSRRAPTGILTLSALARMGKKAAKVRMRTSQITICRGSRIAGPKPEGFTLLELLVVLCLVSLLMAIVFPSLYGSEGMRLKSDAKRIASVLRYLNDSSIATKDSYSLTFDFGEKTMSWKGPDVDKIEQFKSLSSVELPSKGNVNEGQVIVSFGPFGIQ